LLESVNSPARMECLVRCGLFWGIKFIVQERRDQLIVRYFEASPLGLWARYEPKNNVANESVTAICRVTTSSDIIDSSRSNRFHTQYRQSRRGENAFPCKFIFSHKSIFRRKKKEKVNALTPKGSAR
jgi:hypothetical protein